MENTKKELYVTACPFKNKEGKLEQHFIGILRQLKPGTGPYDNGEYEFEYRLGGKFPMFNDRIHGLDDPNKIYNTKDLARYLEDRFPLERDRDYDSPDYLQSFLDSYGLTEYDEFEWLKAVGKWRGNFYTYLYETLPEGVIRYDTD